MRLFRQLGARLRNAHPDHHAIAKGMLWVGLFVFVGAIARASKEIAIAYRYGTSEEVDAYLFVFNILNWPVVVWLSLLTAVLLPLMASNRTDRAQDIPTFKAEFLALCLCLGGGLTIAMWFGLPPLINSSWVGLPANTAQMALQSLTIMAPITALGLVSSLYSVWLLIQGRHANTLQESIPPVILAATALWMPASSLEPLLWGTLAGFVCHLASVSVTNAHAGPRPAPKFSMRSAQWPAFWQGFFVMLLGQTFMSLTSLMDQFFAAQLTPGSIATLNYANRLLALLLGLGGTVVSRATLPVFAHAQARNDFQAKALAIKWAKIIAFVGTLITIAAWFAAPWMVNLLLERGAFTPADTIQVFEVLRWGLLQVPFYLSGLVFVSLITSEKKYHILTAIGLANVVIKASLNVYLAPVYGPRGLMAASSLMMMISTVLLIATTFKKSSQ
ncbi:murein biosynthesis integral membrane protein MurJ [Hydrogenophaga sp. OTU3427]|uniref:murein biosynthesis integral membrane protein MurJ n=1 Tax=Hydrogenophaga sp. OTU3427 TaxID=3043856 RepID=UPI00313D76D2